MKQTNRGFGAIGIIVIVAVVLIAGAVGYLLYQNLSKSSSNSTSSSQSASTSSTDLTNDEAVKIYNTANHTTVLTVADIGSLTQKDSATANYKTAEVSISDQMALFYRTPDGVWHFFVTTQQEMQCSVYNTPDLKKAYLGDKCYTGSNGESTVSLN